MVANISPMRRVAEMCVSGISATASQRYVVRLSAWLTDAVGVAVPRDEALRVQDDVGIFHAVRSVLRKSTQMPSP
jgi:hypothetical protein